VPSTHAAIDIARRRHPHLFWFFFRRRPSNLPRGSFCWLETTPATLTFVQEMLEAVDGDR